MALRFAALGHTGGPINPDLDRRQGMLAVPTGRDPRLQGSTQLLEAAGHGTELGAVAPGPSPGSLGVSNPPAPTRSNAIEGARLQAQAGNAQELAIKGQINGMNSAPQNTAGQIAPQPEPAAMGRAFLSDEITARLTPFKVSKLAEVAKLGYAQGA
jgi:hypothetical protein